MFYYNKKESALFFVIAFCLFILSPLFSFPYIIYGIYRRYKGAVFCFILFLGILAYISIPYEDLYRQMLNFYTFKSHGVTYADVQLNGIIVYIYRLFINYNIPFDYIRLLQIPVSFALLYSIFKNKIENSIIEYSYKEINVRFLLLFLFFDLLYTIYGVRYGFALSFYLYGMYLAIDQEKIKKAIVFFFLAIAFHQAFLFLGILSLFFYKLKVSTKTAIILGLFSIFVTNIGIGLLGKELLGARYDWYFSGKGDNASYSHMTMFGLLGFFLPKICVIPYVHLVLKKQVQESKWHRISVVWLVISLMFLSNAVLFYRTWWVFMSIGIYMLLDIEQFYIISYKCIRRLIISGILFCCFNSFAYHNMLAAIPFSELSKPIPFILSHSYSKEDVIKYNILKR